MAAFLLNFLLSTITALTNVLSFLLLRGAACLFVVIFQAFKIPGEGVQAILQHVAEGLKSVASYLMELLADIVMSVISRAFDLFVEAISSSISMASSAVDELMEMAKSGLETWPKMLEEVIGEASQMVGAIIVNAWENSIDAIRYITENV